MSNDLDNNPFFGISQAYDKNNKPCTLIRLQYFKKNPMFQKVLYGNFDKILPTAISIRDKIYYKLIKEGWKPRERKLFKPKNNTSGVVGVRFSKELTKNGHGYYKYFQVSWNDRRKDNSVWPRAKSFYFTKFNNSAKLAFYKACDFRKKQELKLYDYTLLNSKEYEDYWKKIKSTIT